MFDSFNDFATASVTISCNGEHSSFPSYYYDFSVENLPFISATPVAPDHHTGHESYALTFSNSDPESPKVNEYFLETILVERKIGDPGVNFYSATLHEMTVRNSEAGKGKDDGEDDSDVHVRARQLFVAELKANTTSENDDTLVLTSIENPAKCSVTITLKKASASA
ncbi:hypothetical protein ANAPRD1_01197 [Anaplasma phagocytophilum]|uniref:hypothetical protein n=1 Tax=Anaplasma phagocytophilum TaxID=948 RepID=UPI0007E21EAD|nr:hypothetical protein [Anaplasma phagocytophilum]SCV66669.1 hypothetical protein ANAPRD1_01197 [Anaplasma phagocytophilum]